MFLNDHLRHLFNFLKICLNFLHFFCVNAETTSVFVEGKFPLSIVLNPVRAWPTSCHQLCTCFTGVISVHSVIGLPPLPISEQRKKMPCGTNLYLMKAKANFGKFKFPSSIGSALQNPDPWLGLRFSPEWPHMQKQVLLIYFINLQMMAGKHNHPCHLFHCFYVLKSKACLFEWIKQYTGVSAEMIKLNTADIL